MTEGWERVHVEVFGTTRYRITERLPVDDGWIYRVAEFDYWSDLETAAHLTFARAPKPATTRAKTVKRRRTATKAQIRRPQPLRAEGVWFGTQDR
jgi:hypothetical protein